MKQVTFIHMADLHLDASFSSLADVNKAELRRKELENCLRRIVEKALYNSIDLLIISGDFFEDSNVKGSTIQTAKNLFSELYKTEVIIIPGNHDPLRENSYYKASEWGNNVHILEDSKQVLYLEKYNACIYNMGVRGEVVKDFSIIQDKDISNERFNILIFHGTVDMPFEEENYNPITSEKIFSLGMDYVALGHMHCFSKTKNGEAVMINPGSPEPMGFDEEGVHGIIQGKIILSENEQKSVETEFVPTATRNYHNIEINVSGCSSDEETIAKIGLDNKVKFYTTDLYSITLKGFIPKEYKLGVKNILEAFAQYCFFIKIKNQTSEQFDFEQYLEDPGIKGEFVRRILDMMDSKCSTERRETLYMSLQYGLQAIENGRVDQ